MCHEQCKFYNSYAELDESNHVFCDKDICMLCEDHVDRLCLSFEDKGMTLQNAIDKVGDDNLSYYNDMPKNAMGIITINPDGAVFRYSFKPFWICG